MILIFAENIASSCGKSSVLTKKTSTKNRDNVDINFAVMLDIVLPLTGCAINTDSNLNGFYCLNLPKSKLLLFTYPDTVPREALKYRKKCRGLGPIFSD